MPTFSDLVRYYGNMCADYRELFNAGRDEMQHSEKRQDAFDKVMAEYNVACLSPSYASEVQNTKVYITKLEEREKALEGTIDKLNGRIARQSEKIGDLETDLHMKKHDIPLGHYLFITKLLTERMMALEEEAKEENNEKIWNEGIGESDRRILAAHDAGVIEKYIKNIGSPWSAVDLDKQPGPGPNARPEDVKEGKWDGSR